MCRSDTPLGVPFASWLPPPSSTMRGMPQSSPRPSPGPSPPDESDEGRRNEAVPLTGLVLCGGASRRMGVEKALLVFEGETLLERAAVALATIADPVFAATGNIGRLGPLAWTEVADAPSSQPGAGPLAGIVAGLRAAPHPLVAVLAVDLPYADAGLLRRLAAAWRGESAIVPIDADGRTQPLHAVYAKSSADALSRALAAGTHRVRAAMDGLDVRYHRAGVDVDPRWSRNWNRPEDVDRQP